MRDYVVVLKISQKFLTKVFTSLIRLKNLNRFVCLLFYFMSEFFKLFKDLRLVFHETHIPVPREIIDKGNEVGIIAPDLHIKWCTHVGVYQGK